MGRRYLKAMQVLPRELVEAVSKAMGGKSAYLWIPSGEVLKRESRDSYIQSLADEGYTAVEIADRLFLSERSVWKVLRKMRAAGLPSQSGMGQKQEEPHD
jgi:Mor family transcriptional regulator